MALHPSKLIRRVIRFCMSGNDAETSGSTSTTAG